MIFVKRKTKHFVPLKLSEIRNIANYSFKISGISGDAAIVIIDNSEIHALNKEYRDIDSPTDVLSFASDEVDPLTQVLYLGDIVISAERANEQARIAGRSESDELTMLIVHGCLHLSGLDHSTIEEKAIMKRFQESILSDLNISDPFWPEDEK